jgi:hypothetical protein
MMTSRRAFISALAAFLIGIAVLPEFAAAQVQPAVQVPTPTIRPQKAPNPKAALPTPAKTTATGKSGQPVVAAGPYTHGRVIILRGLYNVFSRGMDKLAKDMEQIGLPVSLYNHSRWQTISAKLIEEYKANPKEVAPVILIGHSLGGDASIVMSNWLALNGVPVRLVVIFDAVAQTHPIIGGVQEVMNFYKPKGYGQEVDAAPSFKGVINNIDLTDRKDVDHLNIDEDDVLHAEVTARVLEIFNEGGKPPKKSTPVAKAAPPAAEAATAAKTPEPVASPGTAPATATAPATPAAGTAPAAAAPPPVAAPAPSAAAETPQAIPAEAPAAAN